MAKLPSSIHLKVSLIKAAHGPLMAEELSLVDGTAPTRQREIVAGRVLARSVMTDLGLAEAPITQSSSGAPVWPPGLCGSIAHSATHVAVAIAPTSSIRSVGIDIEDGRNLDSAAKEIGEADEISCLMSHPLAKGGDGAARLLFSAKEALFKCQSVLTGNTALRFAEVRLYATGIGVLRAAPNVILEQVTATAVMKSETVLQEYQGVILAITWIAR